MVNEWPDLSQYRGCHRAKLIHSGEEYLDLLLELINSAQKQIILHTFIFEQDGITSKIVKSLIEASKREVEVALMIDMFGSFRLNEDFISHLRESGINVNFFSMFNSKWTSFLRRSHQKIVSVDAQKALIGGLNLSDDYLGENPGLVWLDFAVFVEGGITRDIHNYTLSFHSIDKNLTKKDQEQFFGNIVPARFIVNDWFVGRIDINRSYDLAIDNAKDSIFIINSYFIPKKKFIEKLIQARKRGVEVHLVLAAYSDVPFLKWCSEFLYEIFLHHGMAIYEWEKSILHAKIAVVDDKWTTIGSYNIDRSSYYHNLEANVELFDREFGRWTRNEIESIIKNGCKRISIRDLSKVPIWRNIRNIFTYALYRILGIVFLSLFPRFFSLPTDEDLSNR